MPKIGFTPDNKQASPYDYPKVSLERNERALIVVMDTLPWFEFVHTLRMPLIDSNGKVKMQTVQKFGKEVEEIEYEFVGRHICIGDPDVVGEKGVDIHTCPVCKLSTETDAVKPPERRFAAHIIQYATKPGGFELASPFQVSVKAWTFGNKIFDTLTDFREEWQDLKAHDLRLGPCESKQFQKFDIQVSSKAEWTLDAERKKLTAETFKQNQCPDLSTLIARRLNRSLVEEDLDKVMYRHRQAFGGVEPPVEESSLDETAAVVDLGSLLDDDSFEDTSTTVDNLPIDDLESLLEDV